MKYLIVLISLTSAFSFSWGQDQDSTRNPCINNSEIVTSFSPNEDGVNDFFAIPIACPVDKYELTIYSRWGTEIFKIKNNGTPWYGANSEGKLMPSGVYFWTLEYKYGGEKYKEQQNVTLIR